MMPGINATNIATHHARETRVRLTGFQGNEISKLPIVRPNAASLARASDIKANNELNEAGRKITSAIKAVFAKAHSRIAAPSMRVKRPPIPGVMRRYSGRSEPGLHPWLHSVQNREVSLLCKRG